MFQCKDLLTLPSMAKARIIAGKSGLSNRIRWVYKPENMNFAKWVKGQELLIISTPVIQSKDFDLQAVIKKAKKLDMAGALLLVGDKYIASIDSTIISYSNLNDFRYLSYQVKFLLLTFLKKSDTLLRIIKTQMY